MISSKRLFHSLSLITVCLIFSANSLFAQRIKTEGTIFTVEGKDIFMNGVNTPWDKWNDFGGKYRHKFWDTEFQRIREAGGNSSRIWISCDGEKGIKINSDGFVSGATKAHWEDLDDMFALAQKHQIYIMATLLSFDHTKASHPNYKKWRKLISNKEKVDAYVANYVIPFVTRYKNNPYLWSIDGCNEIEWIHQDKDNAQAPWENLQYLMAKVAVAVHQNSEILFTVGSAAIKWNSDAPSPMEKNYWSNQSLQSQVNSPLALLDFYSPHYYGWVVKWFGNFCTEKTPSDYGINDRPCMIGENPATGIFFQTASNEDSLVVPIQDAFIKTYENGWKGLMVWTSNGVDRFGSLQHCSQGLKAFYKKYPEKTYPIRKKEN